MDGNCGAMLKSLYSFKATYSAALTFREGDIFLELDASKSDRYTIYRMTVTAYYSVRVSRYGTFLHPMRSDLYEFCIMWSYHSVCADYRIAKNS